MNQNYTNPIVGESELQFLNQEIIRISKNPKSTAMDLRQVSSMHAVLIAHHSVCIINLLNNADEAEMNQRMGEERREDNPPPGGEKEEK